MDFSSKGGTPREAFSMDATIAAVKDQVSCDLCGEAVVLSFRDGTYYGLNPVGARVWTLIQEPRRVAAILEILLDEFAVDRRRCEEDMQSFLRDLADRKLIEITGS